MFVVLLLSTIFVIAIVHQFLQRKKLPKGPTPLPIIGNIHQLAYNVWKHGGAVQGYNAFVKDFGKVFTIWIGPLPTVYISDYDVAHETHIKRANIFGTRYAPGGMNYIRNGRGIVASNGDFWQEHRRFALTTLRNFGLGRNIMEGRIMDELQYRLSDFEKNNNDTNASIEVDASTFFDLLVGSIINQLMISERFEQNDPDFEKLKSSLAICLESFSLFDIFCPTHILEWDILKWRQDAIFEPLRWIHTLSKRNIQKRVQQIENGEYVIEDNGNDFLDTYLARIEKDKRDGIESTFTLENLAIDMYDLWIAGQETTSTTLTWAGACLLNHPDVVRKIRDEVSKVTGKTRHLSMSDKTSTPYLNATINEVQRVASILNVNLFRMIEEDTVIDGQPLRAGTALTTHLGMIHTDEELFKNSTNFDPDRFICNNGLDKKIIPFGIGKRACLGESLARAELYLILGNLILNYDLKPVGDIPSMKTTSPFSLMKRPPQYKIKFVSVN